jgi:hypothetical protein
VANLYEIMKGKAYGLACVFSGRDNTSAKTEGYKDVFDLIMSDSDHDRQILFMAALLQSMPEGHREILLDGLAREYAGLEGWMQYVERENQ